MSEVDLYYKKLMKGKNLKLAFSQLETSQNISFKNYYRNINLAYDIKLDEHINILKKRLEYKIYSPKDVLKFYIPKKTGLHRPISFLHFDDLIIYQAYANVAKEKLKKKRHEVENINVFSNILNHDKNKGLFFFKKWQEGYNAYLRNIKKLYRDGFDWVAHFDLASYYDTISHSLLVNNIYKAQDSYFKDLFIKCLQTWSTHKLSKISHGIPQGPIASNFFAEIYLLPIDLMMKKNEIKYFRYVDDIKIMGKSKSEVLKGIILLEKECKERGLIPQVKKYEICNAKSIDEALGKFPSLTSKDKTLIISNDKNNIAELFNNAFDEEEINTTAVKFILKTISENEIILNTVKKNILIYPDLIDSFYEFLLNYTDDLSVGNFIGNILLNENILYEYIEGRIWYLFSFFKIYERKYIDLACKKLKQNRDKFSLKLGLYKYLSSLNYNIIPKWLDKESSDLLQMIIIPHLSFECIKDKKFQKVIFNRSDYEPGLVLYKQLIEYNIDTSNLTIGKNDNTGLLQNLTNKYIPDVIKSILDQYYKIPNFEKWKLFLDTEYEHANDILYLSSKSINSDRNAWLNYIDSFNDIVVRQFIKLLNIKESSIRWPIIIQLRDQKIIDLGVILDINNQLSRRFTKITDNFRHIHKRRSSTLASHAYIRKTCGKTNLLKRSEQNQLIKKITEVYSDLIIELNKYL